MRSDSGSTISYWMATSDPGYGPALDGDARADVCVVGAGIAGLTTAYLLARAGRSVIVVDDGPIAGGETCRTTAHLTAVIDDRFQVIERLHGAEGAKLARESHAAAIDRIESIVDEERIACEFERVDGYLFLAPDEEVEFLDREEEAAWRAGFVDLERLPRAPLTGYATGPCLRFPRQAQFHPLEYVEGLADAIVRMGGKIHSRTHVRHVEGGDQATIETTAGPVVRARFVVVATNTPVNDRVTIHTKQASYRTYAVGARIPRGSVPRGLYWDTADPYHYVRLASGGDAASELLIVGGEDHKTGQSEEPERCHGALETWMRHRFPAGPVEYRWSGQIVETIDGLAYIGPNPGDHPSVLVATGDSGMGMTHGTIAGMILSDRILGRPNPWSHLYDPSRKTLAAAADYVGENLNVVAQYLRGYGAPGDVESPDQIAPGSGAVVRRGLHKVAVYRDPGGELHELSAVCPHLGGIVRWNPLEHTWDCPCHGSRFDPRGKVVNGPAIEDLEEAEKGSIHGERDRRAI